MEYGVFSYEEDSAGFNLGDYVQSLAAAQYLPKVDHHIVRDRLAEYEGPKTAVIMNGWFTHKPQDWRPSDAIAPFFTSFHLNSEIYDVFLQGPALEYLKLHQPIGCRDHRTAQYLNDAGIEAYFSGCLTLTLNNYAVPDNERGSDVYVIDPFFNYPDLQTMFRSKTHLVSAIRNKDFLRLGKAKELLQACCDSDLLEQAHFETHILPGKKYSVEEKFEMAEAQLKKYAKAKLVITSRIHCALPCLAMGTPMIFLSAFNKDLDTCRFDGIEDLFRKVEFKADGSFDANFDLDGKISTSTKLSNLDAHKEIAAKLRASCESFIASGPAQ